MVSTGGRTLLSLHRGFMSVAEANRQISYESIFSASRMNKAEVVFLKAEALVNKVIENGLWVKVFSLLLPAVCTSHRLLRIKS